MLYLSLNQFSSCNELPDFTPYKKFGFEIFWCKGDLKSHKKYYYAMQQYPDDIIITIDDDIYYNNSMIEELMKFHKLYPEAVITRRAHLVTWMQEDVIAPYEKWYKEPLRYIGVPRMDLVATGVAGVLYPPHIFKKEIFNNKLFMKKAPYADDLWLKVMELYSEVPVVLTRYFFDDYGLENYSENGLYCLHNINSGNDIQLRALLETYKTCNEDNNLLIKRMGADGKLLLKDCGDEMKRDRLQIFDEYFKSFDIEESILIYGAGNVAEKIYQIFEKTGRLRKINAFIVNYIEENKKELGSIPVRCYIEFLNSQQKIIIGLCEMKQEEIRKKLISSGINKERIIKLNPQINKLISTF